ncbi:MAG: OsmC family protein [Pseudomonadota bacterium]
MKVVLRHVGKMQFTATTESGHNIAMDASSDIGGENAGARPMETVLVGLGGCSAIDVILILKKSRQEISDCRLEIEATRGDEVPAVFRHIHLHYIVSGDQLDKKKVRRAVSLSVEKYCSVTRMLEETAEISYSVDLQPVS